MHSQSDQSEVQPVFKRLAAAVGIVCFVFAAVFTIVPWGSHLCTHVVVTTGIGRTGK